MSTLELGSVFAGDFRVLRPLAEGGMGAVYVVEQLSTGKQRALKLMRPELAHNADARQRFILEARIGGKVQSDHVVEILSAGVDEPTGTPYIVMELLEGQDLAARITRSGPLSVEEVREVFGQLCHAMGAAHQVGIVHRDLKPENVFLARSRRVGEGDRIWVKVLDFGIAKLAVESATRGHTQGMMGTPLWMAPEQADAASVKPAADVWALGLILYFALTGKHFWNSGADPNASYPQVFREVLMGPLPPASQRAREQAKAQLLPEGIDLVFSRAVTRDTKARYQDAREFWNALQATLALSNGAVAISNRSPSNPRISSPGTPVAFSPPTQRAGGAATQAGMGLGLSSHRGLLSEASRHTPATASSPMSDSRPRSRPGLNRMSPTMVAAGATSSGGTSLTMTMTPASVPWWAVGFAAVMFLVVVGTAMRVTWPPDREGAPALSIPDPVPLDDRSAAPPPSCRVCGESTVDGPLTHEAVTATMEAAFPRFQKCLGSSGGFGTFAWTFNVRRGEVTGVRVDPPKRSALSTCLSSVVSDLTFPTFEASTTVVYTFRYNLGVEP